MASQKEIFIVRWRTDAGVRSSQFSSRAEAKEFIAINLALGFEAWLMTIGMRGDLSDQEVKFMTKLAIRRADEMEGTGNAP